MSKAKQHPGDRLKPSREQGMLGVLCRSHIEKHITNTLGRGRNLLSPRLGDGTQPEAITQLFCTPSRGCVKKNQEKRQILVPKLAHRQLLPSCGHNPQHPEKNPALTVKSPAHCHGVVQGLDIKTHSMGPGRQQALHKPATCPAAKGPPACWAAGAAAQPVAHIALGSHQDIVPSFGSPR